MVVKCISSETICFPLNFFLFLISLMRGLLVWLCVGVGSGVRPKVIGGDVVINNDLNFVATLLWCTSGGKSCSARCTGNIIAPNFLLTAAHCIRPAFVQFGSAELSMSLNTLFVLVKSVNFMEGRRSEGSKMIRVKAAFFGTYGTNIVFPYDGDIALLELKECVDSGVGFARVATRGMEPEAGSCKNVTVAGFGRASNAPSLVRDSDGALRVLIDKQHSFSTCRDAYIAISYGGVAPSSTVDFASNYTVLEDSLICSGGTSPAGPCNGDSGGPTFVRSSDGTPVIIGITSFIFSPGFCSIGPSFSTRVALYAEWIASILSSANVCTGRSIGDSFTSWPIPDWPESEFSQNLKRSRCKSSEWQCASFECIPLASVCNGHIDCKDGSDENYTSNSVALCGSNKSNVRNLQASVPCTSALTRLDAAISDASSQWTVGDTWNTTLSTNACSAVEKECELASIPTSSSKYCGELRNFLKWNSTAESFARTFGQRFNATCPDDGYLGWSRSVSSEPETASKNVEISLNSYLIAITLFAYVVL